MCIDKNGDYYDCNQNKPKFVQKVTNAGKAAISVLTGKAQIAPPEIRKNRLEICAECDKIKRKNNLPKGADVAIGDYCDICGCYLKGSKLTDWLKTDFCKVCFIGVNFQCPLKKWGEELGKFDEENEKDLQNESEETN